MRKERIVPSRESVRGLQDLGRAEIRRLTHREELLAKWKAILEEMCAYRTHKMLNLVERLWPRLLRRSRILTQAARVPKRDFGWSLIAIDRRLAHAERRLTDTRNRIREIEEEILLVGQGARMLTEAAQEQTTVQYREPVARVTNAEMLYARR